MFRTHDEDALFALFVKTGKEDKVKQWLETRFYDNFRSLVPKRKLRERKDGNWKENIRVLFPGYVLIRGKITPEIYYELKQTPDLIKLLRSGNDILEIEPAEMKILNRLICNGETIGYSDLLIENDRVQVLDGPLATLEGYIVSINKRKGRARIQMSFMGELRTLDLGISILQKV